MIQVGHEILKGCGTPLRAIGIEEVYNRVLDETLYHKHLEQCPPCHTIHREYEIKKRGLTVQTQRLESEECNT